MTLAIQKILTVFWPIILVAVTVYVCLIVILSIFQSKFIYFPQRQLVTTPNDLGLPYEAVYFEALDGVKLSGWFIPAENARGVVLFCHGNAGNISHRLESILIFYRLGLSTFIFDYRGFGNSEGKPDEHGTYVDVESAWNYLVHKKQLRPEEIIVFGRSLGGAIASWLLKNHTPKVLIIESAFTSARDVAAKFYFLFPLKLFLRFDYNTMEYIRYVNCPVLIVHSRDDELIPFIHGRKLFERANKPKEFLEIKGSHNEGFIISGKQYEEGLKSFISKYIR